MIKYLLLTILTLLFVACGENSSQSTQERVATSSSSKYLSVRRAPTNTTSLVARNERINLLFSATLDTNSVNYSSVYLEDDNNNSVGAIVESGEDSQSVIITPYSYLLPETLYTVVATTEIKDTQGRSLKEDYRYSFTTAADTTSHPSPTLRARKPDINASGVARQTIIALDFNVSLSLEPEESGASYIKLSDSNGTVYDGKIEIFNSILKFTPLAPLPASTTMTVELVKSVQDMYGNVAPNVAPWSFTTATADALIPNDGYSVLSTFNTGATPNLMQEVETNASRSIVAISSGKIITLHSVNYTQLPTKPTITTLGSLTLGSQITALKSYHPIANDPLIYIVVGTLSNGLYILKEENGSLTQLENYPLSEAVYSVTTGVNIDFMTDKIYAVGPKLGLQIFSAQSVSPYLSFVKDVNRSVVGTALDVVDTIDQNNNNLRNLYIADYDGRVVFLDTNGTYKSALDFNGSVKKILVEKDPNNTTQPRFFSITSLGKAQAFLSDGTVDVNTRMSLLDGVTGISNYMMLEGGASLFYSFYSDGGKTITAALYDSYNSTGMPVNKIGLIQVSENIISTEVVNSPINAFLLALSQSGKLSIVNAMREYDGPYLYNSPYDGETGVAADANVTISFDSFSASYLDTATISANSFTVEDVNTSSGITFTFSSQVNTDPNQGVTIIYTLDPDNNLTSGDTYRLGISKDISSMLGTKFNNGVDQNISFTVQ